MSARATASPGLHHHLAAVGGVCYGEHTIRPQRSRPGRMLRSRRARRGNRLSWPSVRAALARCREEALGGCARRSQVRTPLSGQQLTVCTWDLVHHLRRWRAVRPAVHQVELQPLASHHPANADECILAGLRDGRDVARRKTRQHRSRCHGAGRDRMTHRKTKPALAMLPA
jgi:hypothetical protein